MSTIYKTIKTNKMTTFEILTETYQNWLNENNFPQISADELLYDYNIIKTKEQENWLIDFINKWESLDY
jgi:hypothetical protein